MVPTEEEKNKIQEAQKEHPDVPLGTAEQFFVILASVSDLAERLKLWLFKMDFDAIENVGTSDNLCCLYALYFEYYFF